MTVTFAVTVTTGDARPGAEPVDAITAALLGRGFTLLTSHDPAEMQASPVLSGWWGDLSDPGRLRIVAPGELFYDGDLGAAVPDQWRETALVSGRLTVLAATQLDLHRADRGDQARQAQQDGRLVAGHVPLRSPPE